MTEDSEFGRGLVICLVKFAEHFMFLRSQLEIYTKLKDKSPNLFNENLAVQVWLNGASDHLYEIEVPDGKEWDLIREKVEMLKQEGLQGGHGFNNTVNMELANKLMDLTREIALMIDEKIGLEPDIGKW